MAAEARTVEPGDADSGFTGWDTDVPVSLFALKIFTGSRPTAPTGRHTAPHTRTPRAHHADRVA